MQPTLIIVTGRAATGKTTFARWLSNELKFPLVSKDDIRERLFDQLGWKDREWAQLLGKASVDMMFYFAQAELEVGHSIIMDNTFNPIMSAPRFQALKNQYNAHIVQIICNANNETLFERFKSRFEAGNRHPGHRDDIVLSGFWEHLTSGYSPQVEIESSVIELETSDFSKVDYYQILNQVQSLIED